MPAPSLAPIIAGDVWDNAGCSGHAGQAARILGLSAFTVRYVVVRGGTGVRGRRHACRVEHFRRLWRPR